MGRVNLQQLGEWESTLTVELDELRKKRNDLDRDLQRIARKLELVRQMRTLEGAPDSEPMAHTFPIGGADSKASPASVREMVSKTLSESGKPLHINEIHRAFLDKGYPIPGRGTPFNILAHVVNDKAFVRVARGTYTLTGSVPQDQILPKAPRKQKKARRRKRRQATAGGRLNQ